MGHLTAVADTKTYARVHNSTAHSTLTLTLAGEATFKAGDIVYQGAENQGTYAAAKVLEDTSSSTTVKVELLQDRLLA